jgi:tetratricopeptide (TPR) repeat protein
VLFPGFWRVVQWRIDRLWASGDREAAISVAARYARRRPSDPWAWILWGSRLIHAARPVEAETVFREAVVHHPESIELASLLADSLLTQSKVEDARTVLERAKGSHPDSPLSYLGLMSVAKRVGDPRGALALADQAASRIGPDDFNGHYALAKRLVDFPERRNQFEYHLRTAVAGLRHKAMPHMLLAALLEDSDGVEASRQLAVGRRLWRGSNFDHTMGELRELLRTRAARGD